MVASPTKTRTVILAAELPDDFFGIAIEVAVGVGSAEGVVTTAGALKRNVYEPVNGSSVALSRV